MQGDETMQLLLALASAAIPAQTVAPMAMILLQHIMEKISMGGSGERCWRIVSGSLLRPAGTTAWTDASSTSAVLVHSEGLAVQGHQLVKQPHAALRHLVNGLPVCLAAT